MDWFADHNCNQQYIRPMRRTSKRPGLNVALLGVSLALWGLLALLVGMLILSALLGLGYVLLSW